MPPAEMPRVSDPEGLTPPHLPARARHDRLCRLRAARQRQRAQARALRPLHGRPPGAAGDVAAGARARHVAAGGRPIQGRQRRGGRRGRALAQEQAAARDLGVEGARRHRARPAHQLPPPGPLPRAAAALAVDAGAAGGGARRDAPRPQSLRLHRRRLADRGPCRGRGDARRRLQAGDRLGQAEPGGLASSARRRSAGSWTMRASSWPARCGAARATT